jgi:transposase
VPEDLPLLMDRAYEGDETRQLVLALGMVRVVPPKSNRVDPWRYDRTLYKKRSEIERLFRRMKGYRRIFSRFESSMSSSSASAPSPSSSKLSDSANTP